MCDYVRQIDAQFDSLLWPSTYTQSIAYTDKSLFSDNTAIGYCFIPKIIFTFICPGIQLLH